MTGLVGRVQRALKARYRVAMSAVKYIVCRMIPDPKKRESWVICERGTDARDNGYAFYRYMTQKHPEIQVHYLITPDSADYARVAPHAVHYGSWKNYRVVAKADKIVSSHCYTAMPVKAEKVWRMLGIAKRFYLLQHGITQAKMPYMFGDQTEMRLFCCAAKPEYEYVKEYYRHPDGVVQKTGFARYDNLLPFETKQQILVMPTWRRYLLNEEAFLTSDYFAAWNALLNDERLLEHLRQTDTQLIFYPHYELQPYLKHFRTASPNVILADFDHYDVQQLLKESKLLITDYSSVYFDFAYMQKPVLHYQFDSEQYHRQHYKEGYFQFDRDGFGPVMQEHEKLVSSILQIADNGYAMEEKYRERTERFFLYRDQQNCERIYQAIVRQ